MFLCVHDPLFHKLSRDEQLRFQSAILEYADSISPDYELTKPGTWIIALARETSIGQAPAPRLRFGKSTHPDLAHLVAVSESATAAAAGLPPLFTHKDLDPLPANTIARAGWDDYPKILATLHLWGLLTLGDFRQLPRQETAERMGPAAMRLHDTLNHKNQRLLRTFHKPESFVKSICFDHSIESIDALLFQCHKILQVLCSQLIENYLSAASIRLNLIFPTNDSMCHKLALPEPTVSPAVLLRLLHACLEGLRLSEAVIGLEIELEATRPVAAQREYLGRQISQPGRWADTLSRLEALLGPGRVGIACMESSHRPDAFRVHPPTYQPEVAAVPSLLPATPLPLLRFRPPLPVAVATSGDEAYPRPLALLSGPHPGPITRRRGPFPMSGDWWNAPSGWQRIEWDIELESRHLLRLALLPPDQWQIEGRY